MRQGRLHMELLWIGLVGVGCVNLSALRSWHTDGSTRCGPLKGRKRCVYCLFNALPSAYLEQLRWKTIVVPPKPRVICGSVGTRCIFAPLGCVRKKKTIQSSFFFRISNTFNCLFIHISLIWLHNKQRLALKLPLMSSLRAALHRITLAWSSDACSFMKQPQKWFIVTFITA